MPAAAAEGVDQEGMYRKHLVHLLLLLLRVCTCSVYANARQLLASVPIFCSEQKQLLSLLLSFVSLARIVCPEVVVIDAVFL